MKSVWILLTLAASLAAADPAIELISLAKKSSNTPAFTAALKKIVKDGRGVATYLDDVVFAAESGSTPTLRVNDGPGPRMLRLVNSDLWFATARLPRGTSHFFTVTVDGKTSPQTDFSTFGPDSYDQPGVPQGKLSEKHVHHSKVYDGMVSEYWTYAPAQYDPAKPATLLVVQDGAKYASRDSSAKLLQVIDNLTHQKKIPVGIVVMIQPGKIGERAMRSIEYDTVNDTYARYLREEIIKEVEGQFNLRQDGYSRAIMGESSGAICAFTVAWFDTERYQRVFSRIGTYTSIQWKPGQLDGGNIYPFLIRKSDRRNIRIWIEDGANDLENSHGSWPLQNIQMANSLKMKEYDFHFSFGTAQHNTRHGDAQAPEAFTWLWRGYDPAKTSETFTMDPAEKDKPYWRVKALNRE